VNFNSALLVEVTNISSFVLDVSKSIFAIRNAGLRITDKYLTTGSRIKVYGLRSMD
jgi:hypothetical protein